MSNCDNGGEYILVKTIKGANRAVRPVKLVIMDCTVFYMMLLAKILKWNSIFNKKKTVNDFI